MKFTLLILLTLQFVLAQDLPHRLTPAEKERMQDYVLQQQSKTEIASAPSVAVRSMAEWEELQGIQITWTSYFEILAQIVDYAQEEAIVYIVCSDSNQVKLYLSQRNIPLTNLKFIVESFNSVWCRDYGPWSAYEQDVQKLDILDWIYNRPRPDDDQIPAVMATFLGNDLYEAVQDPDDLVHTGGNFMVDGHGTGFASKLILEENSDKNEVEIDDILERYLGINRFIKMETLPYDEIHHIDMHMKLLDEETLLVGEYPAGVADGPQIEANLQYILNNHLTCFNRPFNIVRIPMPPDARGRYPDDNGEYRTYTNSIIVNKTVLVPVYEEQYDTTALRIYREAMPGYQIVGIDCNDIIGALGAIHCITKEIGVEEPVWISHAAIQQAFAEDEGYRVAAKIKSESGIDLVRTFWSTDTSNGFQMLEMNNTGRDSFQTFIPSQNPGTKVYYYISAHSNSGRNNQKPLVAPKGLFSFEVDITSEIADPVATVKHFELQQNYPNPFNPETVIRYQFPVTGFVNLAVYNMLGQKVRTLVNRRQEAGKYSVTFKGDGLSSGVYYYNLHTANGNSQIKKMVLIK